MPVRSAEWHSYSFFYPFIHWGMPMKLYNHVGTVIGVEDKEISPGI